ncbi:hypothetical protein T4D_11422 [Trichinella pseudospiralis]|uniref:Uncharacterized protein n=1 Tax=Trichinella pseudospiralis TaxID=6337 RepID=A0A0V1F815_TRIPS|nr:hypothetical protein T4D_11422 [Trichinella pseudospiralis]
MEIVGKTLEHKTPGKANRKIILAKSAASWGTVAAIFGNSREHLFAKVLEHVIRTYVNIGFFAHSNKPYAIVHVKSKQTAKVSNKILIIIASLVNLYIMLQILKRELYIPCKNFQQQNQDGLLGPSCRIGPIGLPCLSAH